MLKSRASDTATRRKSIPRTEGLTRWPITKNKKIMNTTLTHYGEIAKGHVVLFAEEGNDHYGDFYFELTTELPAITDELVAFAAGYYEIDAEEARDLVDPSDIVDSAGAWDDVQFVSDLWQAMESGALVASAGYRTYDGAVVLDLDAVELIKKEAE